MGETNPVRRGTPPQSGTATKLFVAGGLTLAGWLLSAALASPAYADEAPSGTASGSGGVTTTVPAKGDAAVVKPAPSTPVASKPVKTKPVKTTPAPSQPVKPVTTKPATTDPVTTDPAPADPVTPAPTAPVSTLPDMSGPDSSVPDPSAPDSSAPDSSVPDSSVPDSSAPDSSAPDSSAPDSSVPADDSTQPRPGLLSGVLTGQPSPTGTSGSPLGGSLLNGLVGTVVNTLNRTVHSVGGLVGSVGGGVLPPVSGDEPGPDVLPDFGDFLPGGWISGGGSHNEIVVALPMPGKWPTEPARPERAPAAPATPTNDETTSSALREIIGVDATRHAAQHGDTTDTPRSSNQRAAAHGGGASGGGQLPIAPATPMAPTGNISAGHDTPTGGRQFFAVLGTDHTTTQLRLIGTSLDHEVDGAGRDAALPMTAPD